MELAKQLQIVNARNDDRLEFVQRLTERLRQSGRLPHRGDDRELSLPPASSVGRYADPTDRVADLRAAATEMFVTVRPGLLVLKIGRVGEVVVGVDVEGPEGPCEVHALTA